jgi:prevent-host-death family protein
VARIESPVNGPRHLILGYLDGYRSRRVLRFLDNTSDVAHNLTSLTSQGADLVSLSEWSIADAKSKLSEVLNLAEHEAQVITRRNRQYVVLDGDEYRRLMGKLPTLKQTILQGPSLEAVDLERDPSGGRELSL